MDPVVASLTRSFKARIFVNNAQELLRPDTYVDVTFHINFGTHLTIPKSALIDTGNRKIVFVKKDNTSFEPKEVEVGAKTENDIEVLKGLHEGDQVVTNATFMVDSESQLKTPLSGGSQTPTCPEGQKWDASMNMCM
jgi:Cu(I)/Ag(I) efflux system membrane fusion protein